MDGESSLMAPVQELDSKPPALLGWSLAPQLQRPKQKVELSSLMREKETRRLDSILGAGQKAFIYGGDGYGKSTMLLEYDAYLKSRDRSSLLINVLQFRSQGGLKSTLEYLDHLVSLPREQRPVVMVDSADYLWEKCDPALMRMRQEFYKRLLESDLECIFTYHLEESKGKKTDLGAESVFRGITESQPSKNIVRMHLSSDYEVGKTKEFLLNLGFIEPIARFISELPFARNHALLVNYFVKELEQKQYQELLNRNYTSASERQQAGEAGQLARVMSYIRNIFSRYDQQRTLDLNAMSF